MYISQAINIRIYYYFPYICVFIMSKIAMDDDWKDRARGILKAELARRNIKQVELAKLLEDAYGLKETPQSLSNKISRGTFSAVFMLQILEAIGVESLTLKIA